MPKFYTFFILFLLGVTLNARPLNLNQAVERAVSTRTAQAAKKTYPQAVLFTCQPLDEGGFNSRAIKKYEELAESLQRQHQLLGLCSSTEPPEEEVDDFVTICPGAETIDFEKTFFIKGKEKSKASFSPQEKALLQQMQQLASDIRIEDSIKEYYDIYVK